MRVLACYAGNQLRPETYRALVRYVPVSCLEMVNVEGNVSNYWHEFRRRWKADYELITVEQDNVITADVLPSFQMCTQPWCVFEYLGPPHMSDRWLATSLGCSRFSRSLQAEVPISEISESDYFTWHLIDFRLGIVLREKGYTPHVHGQVDHLHAYETDPTAIANDAALHKLAREKGHDQDPDAASDPAEH
jgi:hypothetical protein